MHPDLFAKVIRPQEEHSELINSLINEAGLLHVKRIFISLLVYLVLMVVLVIVPLILCRYLLHCIYGVSTVSIKVWYLIPEVQIPLELLAGHIVFLSILDRKKEVIGRMQHHWLIFLSQHLGLFRFLIPLPKYRPPLHLRMRQRRMQTQRIGKSIERRQQERSHNIENGNEERVLAEDVYSNNRLNIDPTREHKEGDYAQDVGNREEMPPAVGRPILRPPPGWDMLTPNTSVRRRAK